MANKKITLYAILGLLVIFLPLTILGFLNKDNLLPKEENINHEFKYNNKLWFYDENNKLINSYSCINNECDYAETTIDDVTYNLEYYKEGTNNKTSLLNGEFAFIKDGEDIFFYNINTGNALLHFKQIKNYGTYIEDDSYIIKDENNKYGIVSFANGLKSIIPYVYDFISLKNYQDNELKLDRILVLKDNKWFIIDKENNKLSAEFDEKIFKYDNNVIYTKENNIFNIYDYAKNLLVANILEYNEIDQYMIIKTNEYYLIYDNLNNEPLKRYIVANGYEYNFEKTDNGLNIILNNNIIDTLDL